MVEFSFVCGTPPKKKKNTDALIRTDSACRLPHSNAYGPGPGQRKYVNADWKRCAIRLMLAGCIGPMLIQGNRMELERSLSLNLWILENRKVIRKWLEWRETTYRNIRFQVWVRFSITPSTLLLLMTQAAYRQDRRGFGWKQTVKSVQFCFKVFFLFFFNSCSFLFI